MTLALQLRDYRLTTAEILYHLPDHPGLLQTYIWQELDLAPRYPALRRFLDFWERELDGKLHSIKVATGGPIRPASVRHAAHLMHLHWRVRAASHPFGWIETVQLQAVFARDRLAALSFTALVGN